jgi:hypothetical protein
VQLPVHLDLDPQSAAALAPLIEAVRAVRATIWVAAAAVLVRTWAVDVLSLVDERGWSEFSRAWTTTVVTALLAYFCLGGRPSDDRGAQQQGETDGVRAGD